MNLPEYMRKKAVLRLFDMTTFDESFEVWKDDIEERLGSEPGFHDILDLGDSLKEIFTVTGDAGRTQADVSQGGAAWEGLTCWYLNLCLVGTRTVVIKHNKDLIPEPVEDAITVKYDTFASNTESDLVAITFPDKDEITSGIDDPESFDYQEEVDEICKENLRELEVGIIQCKTNWKDNAQIPMLWDMIYSSEGFNKNITLGSNGFTMKNFQDFFYAFVTVPSHKPNYTPNSTAVKRVQNISGGNYWGKPSKDGVADSLKELFNGNFDSGWEPKSQRERVEEMLDAQKDLSYFDIDCI